MAHRPRYKRPALRSSSLSALLLASLSLCLCSAAQLLLDAPGHLHHLSPRQAASNATLNANTSNNQTQASGATFSASSDAPAGSLVFTLPPATAVASFYKIAENQPITFGWSFTNVLSYGHSLTVAAYCSLNKITYDITTLPGEATILTWDPYALQQKPGYPAFAEATYTLQIYDERGLNAKSSPGLLSPSTTLKFAMYKPQAYTPLASWTCTTCSGSPGSHEAYSPVLLACIITLVSVVASGSYGVLVSVR